MCKCPGVTEETVGQRLRRLRTDRGMSQRELSSPGVSYAYISRIEAGTRVPSVKALRKLARKLGVSAEYLETGSDVTESDLRELRLTQAELDLRLEEDPGSAERALRELLGEAEGAGDVHSVRRATIALGLAAFSGNRLGEAIALLERVVHEYELNPSMRPDVYATLGRAYAMQGRAGDAAALFESCLAGLADDTPEDRHARIRFTTYLSFALTDAGELERAEEALRGVVNEVEGFADPYTQVRIYWSLGRLAGLQGRPADALEQFRRAVGILEATEDTLHLARAHLACAWSLIENERAEDAGPYLEAAEQLLGTKPAPADLAALRAEQARRAVALGQADAAVDYANEALAATGDAFAEERGIASLALAQGLAMRRDTDRATEAFRESVEAFQQAGKHGEAAQAYQAWGRMLREAGREAEAMDAFDRAADLAVRSTRAEA
jgi:transcriptional regulator with XRE-family HTH domain